MSLVPADSRERIAHSSGCRRAARDIRTCRSLVVSLVTISYRYTGPLQCRLVSADGTVVLV